MDFLKKYRPKKKNDDSNKNKISSDMRSVPDLIQSKNIEKSFHERKVSP